MKQAIRKDEILSLLNQYNYLSVEFLSNKLHISQSSIRRDLAILEAQGLVKRSHGGVHSLIENNTLTPRELRMQENATLKRMICQKAAELIKDGDTIFIDGSTTCLYLVDFLESKKNITILTNNLKLAAMLEHNTNITIYCTGGLLRLNELVAMGAIAENSCRYIHTNIMFFSARAIDENGIITDLNEPEVVVRQIAMENTDKTVFLCDSSKFDKRSIFTVCDSKDVDCIITDAEHISTEWKVENIISAKKY